MKKFKISKGVALALAVLLPVCALAAGKLMKPGSWQVTMTMKMAGTPYQLPPRTVTRCVKPGDVKDPKDVIRQNQKDKSCQVSNVKETGNKITWDVVCKGGRGTGSGHGEMTFASDHYEGNIQVKVENRYGIPAQQMNTHIQGRRLGDCR